MKMKKILALGLTLAMVLGTAAACDSNTSETTTAATTAKPAETTEAPAETTEAPAETTEAPEETTEAPASSGLTGFNDLGAAEAENEGSDKIVVWSWNSELGDLVKAYSSVDADCQIVGGDQDPYRQALEQALASGDQAPDVFATDASWAQLFLKGDDTLPINTLGVNYGDLTNMYNYTLQFAADDEGVLKGLAWQACPCGVFYNSKVAQDYLGVSEPADVAPHFATWDAVLETAKTVNEASEGKVKAISGYDDVWLSFLNRRTSAWIVDGAVNVDPVLDGYFDLAKTLYDEDLTFKTTQWGDGWLGNASNGSVLSYWGPMWLAKYSMGLGQDGDGDGKYDNPTAGDWRIVNSPDPFYWGGTWIMATTTCDMKKDAGQIMNDLCINQDNLKKMAQAGEFVNSVPIMTDVANDASFGLDWLGGQNPFSVLLESAMKIDNSVIGVNDGKINDLFGANVGTYVKGEVETVAEAKAAFEAAVKEAGLLD